MSARIIERGRGPEIEGTRITVYDIMDYERASWPVPEIAQLLSLTTEQVQVALQYIADHRPEVEAVYEKLLERDRQGNPEWLRQKLADGLSDLRRRIEALKRNGAHDQTGCGQ